MKKIMVAKDSANVDFARQLVQLDNKRKLVEFGKVIEVEDWVYDILMSSSDFRDRVSLIEEEKPTRVTRR